MDQFQVRVAKISDARSIAEVHVASWQTTYKDFLPAHYLSALSVEEKERLWKERLSLVEQGNEDFILYVVEENEQDKIVGFVCGGKDRKDHPVYHGELYTLYLLQEYQRKGLGQLLVHRFALWLHEHSYQKMRVWVLDRNPARKFYEALGGQLLPEIRKLEFGGQWVLDVSYGWENLREMF